MKKGKYSLKINEMNLEIQKMVNPEKEKSTAKKSTKKSETKQEE